MSLLTELRIAPDAQQEICELAKAIKKAMEESVPLDLVEGEYHLPYVKDIEFKSYKGNPIDLLKASVARCARVSYLNHDKSEPDVEKDISLHDFLYESKHMSPFEHVATPSVEGSGNFRGWTQYRNELEN